MPPKIAAAQRSTARPFALVLAVLGVGSACAQSDGSSPYYFGVSQGFTHQTNLFGASKASGAQVEDKYSTTGLLGGIDIPISRQRLFANGVLRANRYEDVKILNNNSYGLNLGLDWQTIGDISGQLRVSANRSLASYTTAGAPAITNTRNIETSNQSLASIRKGITSRLAITGGVQHRRVEFSAPSFAAGELSENQANVGIRYGRPDQLVLGIGYRKTKTERPRYEEVPPGSGVYSADKADRDDVDLSADWAISGLSTLSARLSFGSEDHSLPTVGGFSGTTGSLGWSYRPSGRTSYNAMFSRDTGTSASFTGYSGNAEPLQVYSNRLTNVFQAGATYDATAKIQLVGSARYSKGQTTAVSATTTGDDKVVGASLGASYAVNRAISLNCNVSHEKRDTGVDEIASRVVGCSGQFTLR
jgi:hypothetical protein